MASVHAPADVIEIKGRTYTLEPLDAVEERALYRLTSDRGSEYYLVQTANGPSCDCPHQTLRCEGTGRTCKHIARLVELGLLSPPVARRPAVEPRLTTAFRPSPRHRDPITPAPIPDACDPCAASGTVLTVGDSGPEPEPCPDCEGTGVIDHGYGHGLLLEPCRCGDDLAPPEDEGWYEAAERDQAAALAEITPPWPGEGLSLATTRDFAGWIDLQADLIALSGADAGASAWLAAKVRELASEARMVRARCPDEFDDRMATINSPQWAEDRRRERCR